MEIFTYMPTSQQLLIQRRRYLNVCRIMDRPVNQTTLRPVEVYHHSTFINILGYIPSHKVSSPTQPNVQEHLWRQLEKGLQQLCGKIKMPADQGKLLMEKIRMNKQSLIGVSDASIQNGSGSHAWILTSESNKHIMDPNMTISGIGPSHGTKYDMSSARAELQGKIALTS